MYFCNECAVPTGLLALQGQDDLGLFIRNNLKKLGVATEFIQGEPARFQTV